MNVSKTICLRYRFLKEAAIPRSWSEVELRKMESGKESFGEWQKKLLRAVGKYPAKEKLVASMARKCADTLKRKGGSIDD